MRGGPPDEAFPRRAPILVVSASDRKGGHGNLIRSQITDVRCVARFGSGHHQRVGLSPVSAISDMVAPVVLLTVTVIFGNGLVTAGSAIRDRLFALNRERLGILRGPDGELLDEDSVPSADRERLAQITDQMPVMIRRVRHLRTAVLIIWITAGVLVLSVAALVLSVAALAVAVTARSEAFAFALALVTVGVAGVFTAVAAVIGPAARSATVVLNETRRTGMLG
jgi:hypothetical protein